MRIRRKEDLRQDLIEVIWRDRTPKSPYPALNTPFNLFIDRPFTGMDMAYAVFSNKERYPAPHFAPESSQADHGWSFDGREMDGFQFRAFMLVNVGYQRDHKELVQALEKLGTIPEGQWCVPFMKAFPVADKRHSVAIADASWCNGNPHGMTFPRIGQDGELGFADMREDRGGFRDEPMHGYDESIFWLLEVRE